MATWVIYDMKPSAQRLVEVETHPWMRFRTEICDIFQDSSVDVGKSSTREIGLFLLNLACKILRQMLVIEALAREMKILTLQGLLSSAVGGGRVIAKSLCAR